jgi:hypothetical protein
MHIKLKLAKTVSLLPYTLVGFTALRCGAENQVAEFQIVERHCEGKK